MKQSLLWLVFLLSVLPVHSIAQRGAIRGSLRFSGNRWLLPGTRGVYDGLGNYGYGWGYPTDFDDYAQPGDYSVNDQYPNISVPESESCGPVVLQPPPQPVRSEIHEYKWPNTDDHNGATFALLLKDGSVRSAIAVWVQGNTIHYVTPDGDGRRLGLYSLNRPGTRLANAAKHLTLWLPADTQSDTGR